ncbi:hypothetical protein LWF15_00095 [Kineosporia rhizophila]|uniref:Dyp-type peroxidase n=1 Tax=Kineosporia TaxID=49184 RepID=UPI001E3EAB42|nr:MULTISPECIES: hypothetical protein [Kineosporia]MCE0533905.1 hypothetical protein [Kineosporia rhizophila]GLY13444.1 hypothetical protein Kisp01_04600 [Kineosporia sp. NBRC 101677]
MPTTKKPALLRRVLPSALARRLPAGLVHEYIDPPTGGRQRVLTVMTRVPDEAVEDLRADLARIRAGASPFRRVPGTHFARLAVMASSDFTPQSRPDRSRMALSAKLLHLLMHGGREQEPDRPETSYLLFSASYDGPGRSAEADQADYAERLRRGLGEQADRIWGRCEGYPGRHDGPAFAAFLTEHALRSGYVFSASDTEPSVDDVHAALELRRRVADLALDTEGLDDTELAARLRAEWDEKILSRMESDLGDLADLTPNDLSWPTLPVSPTRAPDRVLTRPSALPVQYAPPPVAPEVTSAQPARVPRLGGGTPPVDPDLTDVQNLVSSGYPRHHAARHLLLEVTDAAAARDWLARLIDDIPTAGWAENLVDRLGRDVEGADSGTPTKNRPSSPTFAAHVAISYTGLAELGLPPAELTGFPAEFTEGMAAREAGLIPGTGTSTWQAPFSEAGSPHLLLMLSAPDHATLDAELATRPHVVPGDGAGLIVLDSVEAGRISDAPSPDGARAAGFREHFGFVDGISQPRVHGVTTGRHTAELPPGETLLGYRDIDGDTAGAGLPASIGRNGSYLVWRKLEQDVDGFDELTRELAGKLAGTVTGRSTDSSELNELAAAKLMGRWRDGTPVTLSTEGPRPSLAKQEFLFQESDAEGHGCPVGAHIRRANPRDSRPKDHDQDVNAGKDADLESRLALRHRMLRRGIPYGLPVAAGTWAGAPAPDPSDELPDTERGLLFVALVGDIHRQFEFVQAHWMSDGNAFRLGADRDVISGAAPAGSKFVAQGRCPAFVEQRKQVVTCRGGEYFLLPGIKALRQIARR